MGQASCTVRRAGIDDAHEIARVHVHSWREAYGQVFSRFLLQNLDVTTRTSRWQRILRDGATEVWVAEFDAAVVGWASAGAPRDVDAPAPRELHGIYVLAAQYGSGAGQGLLDAALGTSAAFLWVLGANSRAQAFYRRNGFVADGATKVDTFGGEPAYEVRMVRPATS